MQRGWVKGRDDCWKGSDPRGCVEFNYLHREAELVAAWSLEEPTWVATYVCGDKGTEVTASFFDTEIPAVRIDRVGEAEAGVLDSFSEGTRYSAYPGTSLVVDADDAWLQWRDGPEEMCVLQS
jgi:hypothetical protein